MSQSPAPVAITYGVYFGECVGYCTETIEVGPTEIVYTQQSNIPNPALPDRVYRTPTKPEIWGRLTGAADWSAARALPARQGQPDAADQGGEYIELTDDQGSRRVDLEYGASLPELAGLLESLRALRTELVAQSGF